MLASVFGFIGWTFLVLVGIGVLIGLAFGRR